MLANNAKYGFVVPANYNYSGQTSISGNLEAIDEAVELLKEAGAKRVIKLNTSGPFHTSKLEKAKQQYCISLDEVNFNNKGNGIKVIKNIDGNIYTEKDNIKEILSDHIVSPVRFDKAIKYMESEKVNQYVEIGPGKVLTGFIKKENRDANIININNAQTLEKFLEQV